MVAFIDFNDSATFSKALELTGSDVGGDTRLDSDTSSQVFFTSGNVLFLDTEVSLQVIASCKTTILEDNDVAGGLKNIDSFIEGGCVMNLLVIVTMPSWYPTP